MSKTGLFSATIYREHLDRAPTDEHMAWRRKWLWGSIGVVPCAALAYYFWQSTPLPIGKGRVLTSVYPDASLCPYFIFLFGSLALYNATYLIFTLALRDPAQVSRREKTIFFVLWTIIPPLYFFVEWFFIFPTWGRNDSDALEAFKQGQSVARNMWAGFVALFGASNLSAALRERR